MLRHAARAVPWLLLAVVAVVLALLVRTVAQWPWQTWPLQGVAVGLLAAAAAYAFDEPAADLVDTLPRSLRWRTAARGTAVLLLVLWWVVLVALAGDAWFGHPWAVAGQGVAAALLGTAAAVALRRRGSATPAGPLASGLLTVAMFWSLARPAEEAVPLFPYSPLGPWTASAWLWSALGAAAALWLAVELSERYAAPAWSPRRSRPAGSG